MIDRDGRFEYSAVRMVDNSHSFYVNIYPNPAKEKLNLLINSERNMTMQLQVISADGKVLLKKMITVKSGTSLSSVDITSLQSGHYFLKISSSEAEHVLTFRKQ